ncbi:MAG: DNA-binding protein WhiA [Lachnospiraceae bacterium]|nr:DNA-binding protein WhiA [Lachnospiraceae bacterium]
MSFSSDVKNEICSSVPEARHCQLACLAGLTLMSADISFAPEKGLMISYHTENEAVSRLCFTLLKKTIRICADVQIRWGKTPVYRLLLKGDEARSVCEMLKIRVGDRTVNSLLYERSCCRRNLIKGAFLSGGSVSRPDGSYHMEFVCDTEEAAESLRSVIGSFNLESRIIRRKNNHVVYLKDGDTIVTMLNIMGAPLSLMDMENARILKDMRNTVNRRVNCETANIAKTVNAAVRQVNDIEYIRDLRGFGFLSDPLREMAEVRLAHPDAALKELGDFLDPPVGKSGVNHRLRKLSQIADDLRRNIYDQENS